MNAYLEAQNGIGSFLEITSKPLKNFSKNRYASAFDSVYGQMVPTFDAVEELYLSVKEPDTMISNMAVLFTSSAQERLKAIRGRNKQDIEMMNMNMQLAVFIFPGILAYKGKSSKPLADAISEEWKRQFPKSNVTQAEFADIEKGFHKRFCYITTAVCESRNLPDDCYELTLLREYRDSYMMEQPRGEEMVQRYYDVAPSIVKHINARTDSSRIYDQIYRDYISPCIHMIQEGKNEDCLHKYIEMVDTLRGKYFFS